MDQDIQCLWFCRALLIIARFPCSNLDNSQWSDLEATWCSHIEDQYSMFTPRRHSMFIPRRYCMFIPRRSILKCSDVDDTPYSHSENAEVFRCGWYSCSKLHDTPCFNLEDTSISIPTQPVEDTLVFRSGWYTENTPCSYLDVQT